MKLKERVSDRCFLAVGGGGGLNVTGRAAKEGGKGVRCCHTMLIDFIGTMNRITSI